MSQNSKETEKSWILEIFFCGIAPSKPGKRFSRTKTYHGCLAFQEKSEPASFKFLP